MHHSKPIQILKMLDEPALKRLAKFLKSPFYNANPSIVKLYLILRTDYPFFTAPKLGKERVFKKLFPKRPYDHQKLLNLMSDFTALLQQYLQLLQLDKQPLLQNQLLLNAYSEQSKHYPTFLKQVKKNHEQLEKQPFRDTHYYQQKFHLHQSYFNHPGTDKFQLNKDQMDESMAQLDQWYLQEKLLLSCEMKARERPLSEHYDIWLLPEIRQNSNRYKERNGIIEVYLAMLALLETEGETAYFNLKKLLLDNLSQYSLVLQKQILQSLINYTIQRGNSGQTSFVKENLELYQFGLDQGLFLDQEVLNDMTYIGIVNIALRANELTWCFQFIEQYAIYLDDRRLKDATSLAMALWLYAKQQPKETIKLLQAVDFLNVYYQIQARVLMIKVYVEAFQKDREYYDLLVAQTNAFERFLRRNKKIAKGQKKALLNLAIWIKRLAKMKTAIVFDEKEKLMMKTKIEALVPFYNRSWFLKQI